MTNLEGRITLHSGDTEARVTATGSRLTVEFPRFRDAWRIWRLLGTLRLRGWASALQQQGWELKLRVRRIPIALVGV